LSGVVFIEELPDVCLDAAGARLEYRSGGEHFIRRYPEILWRAFIAREARRLEEWDAKLAPVVPFKRKRRAH
jgi:hypothetical protein